MQNKCRIKQYEQYTVQAEAAIDRNFEIFLPKFLKIPVRELTFSKAVKVKINV